MKEQQLFNDLKEIFKEFPDALNFSYLYCEYIHKVDDIIDENGSFRDVLKMSSLASLVFTTPFWQQYGTQLILVEQLINNQYADSIEWESSKEEWQAEDAKCLSHAGYNMLYAIILLLKGYDELRKISGAWRERAHRIHREHSEKKCSECGSKIEFTSYSGVCVNCFVKTGIHTPVGLAAINSESFQVPINEQTR